MTPAELAEHARQSILDRIEVAARRARERAEQDKPK